MCLTDSGLVLLFGRSKKKGHLILLLHLFDFCSILLKAFEYFVLEKVDETFYPSFAFDEQCLFGYF